MYNFFIRILTYPFIILLNKIFDWILSDDVEPPNKNKKIIEDP
jgi:hypothetical protein